MRDPASALAMLDADYTGVAGKNLAPAHMLAGNMLRMKKDTRLDPHIGNVYARLSPRQKRLGGVVDSLFWFWAK